MNTFNEVDIKLLHSVMSFVLFLTLLYLVEDIK